jgi:hypothetical protein
VVLFGCSAQGGGFVARRTRCMRRCFWSAQSMAANAAHAGSLVEHNGSDILHGPPKSDRAGLASPKAL